MARYIPAPVPTGDLQRFLLEELNKIAQAMETPDPALALDTLYAPPNKFRDGTIVKADGATWNPGYGAGMYCFYDSAWHFLSGGDGTLALTSGATVNTDAKLSRIFTLTLAINATLANPTNLQNGMSMRFRIKQDGTGSRTLAYGSKFKFPSGTAPVLSTAVSAVDVLSCVYFSGDDRLECNMLKAFA